MDNLRGKWICQALLVIAATCAVQTVCSAQAASAGSRLPGPSSVDVFGGFDYLHPISSDLYGQNYVSIPDGFVAGLTGYFSRSIGIEAEYTKFLNSPDYCFSTVQAGPVLRYQYGRLIPFAHILGGGAQVGPSYQHSGAANTCTWGWGADGGVGIDYVLPTAALRNHLAIRAIEADFQFTDVNFGPQTTPGSYTGGDGRITAYRLSTGLVYRLGESPPPLPASYGCEVDPVTLYPGDPITVSGRVINLEHNRKVGPTYTWSTTGGSLTRHAEGATIATDGLAAGEYTVIGTVSEGSRSDQHAKCSASFRVVALPPPTISCSAAPSSILPGGFAIITSVGKSPKSRPLNYSYGATAGQITGSGPSATLAAANVGTGVVNITCNVVDDLGKSASAKTSVTVTAPPPPPLPPAPVAHSLCSISFERDKERPARVDNEAKACLDDIALELNRESEAVLVVVGKHDSSEKPDVAAERTLNVKQYLTQEKGIDANRIEVRTGESTGRTVNNVLVPPGATWDTGATTSFDPTRVQRHGQPYGRTRH